MAVPKITILLAHERSGSHLMGEFLGSLAGVRMIDEVCNAEAVKPLKHPESFHRFKHDAIMGDPKLLLEPSRERHAAFVQSYFQHLLGLKAPNNIAIDIKYGHVHNFESWWWPIFERPFLLKHCEAENIGVIHLFRENVVESTASGMIADKRKIWHSWAKGAAETADRTFNLPVQNLIRRAKQLEIQTRWFKQWIGNARKATVTYERISAELGQAGELDSTLAEIAGGTPKKAFKPRHQKLTRPLREVVENFDELKQACDEAGLGGYIS